MAEFKEVIKKRNEICGTYHTSCNDCPLRDLQCDSVNAMEADLEVIERKIMNWKKPVDWTKVDVDWSKVEVDTPILVSSNNISWIRRYFAKYEDEKVYAFNNGATSWITDISYSWDYAKLWEGAEE